MRRHLNLAIVLILSISVPVFANGPAETIVDSERVLGDLMAIPAKQIPQQLLMEAQGIAIIPHVIKIGFIAGGRRGHGVVMVRDADGEWSLPQFVALTGGSVGWQAGVQDTDVVLVFRSRQGVTGLMNGKFTIGVDASVAAGPLGREAAAGTDAQMQSEVLSYSRSRGLFVGVSLDGSVLEIDHESHMAFYGAPTGTVPRRVPGTAAELRHFLSDLTTRHPSVPGAEEPAFSLVSPRLIESLRRALIASSAQLQVILNPEWQQYLALPKDLQAPGKYPSLQTIATVREHYTRVETSAEYRNLARTRDFQYTYELLREYERALIALSPSTKLPPPPSNQ